MGIGKFRTGNVIRTKYGTLEIVVDVKSDGYTETIHVCSSNTSAGHKHKTYVEDVGCICGYISCPICGGHEKNLVTIYGMEDAVLVAPTVKDWITNILLEKFNFNQRSS